MELAVYQYNTLCVTLGEESRPRVCEKWVLGEFLDLIRIKYSVDIHNLYCLRSVIRMVTFSVIIWAEHVECTVENKCLRNSNCKS